MNPASRFSTYGRDLRSRVYPHQTVQDDELDDGYFSISGSSDTDPSQVSSQYFTASDRSLDLPPSFQLRHLSARENKTGFVEILKNGDPIAIGVVLIAIAAVLYIMIFCSFSTREKTVIQDVTIVLPSPSGDCKSTLRIDKLMGQIRTKAEAESDPGDATPDEESPGFIMSFIKLIFQLLGFTIVLSLLFHACR